ncbi:MAG: acetylxylan esterase, partial [Lentisphaeria bacterium]|nr:acetylxylan esterase [Lentisphaeria bacterium]
MSRNGYQHMVLDYYVDRVRAMRTERSERLASIRSTDDARAYQAEVQAAVDRAFAPRPERCPLNARVTRVMQQDGFRVEMLRYESRPGFFVTANLYVPEPCDRPAPAVIGACGHSAEGKANEGYSAFAQRLVRNGFIVLLYEPCNQGERDQYARLAERSCVAGCCAAHNMMGKQLELVGENYSMWRAWDGVRALDLLLERDDVDSNRIGVTGNSGGGTMTTWLWASEPRFTMAAPSCFVTTFLRNLENELPADCEQYPPGVIGAGLEMADMMICRAPKPVILLGQKYDFFERRGVREAYDQIRHFYSFFGAEDQVRLFMGPQTHGYSVHNQEAMVEFFVEQAGQGTVTKLPEPEVFTLEQLQVTPAGSVVDAGSRPIYELIDERAAELEASRPVLSGAELAEAVGATLDLPALPDLAPHFRIPRAVSAGGRTYARYAVETEDGIRAILCKRLVESSWGHTLDVEEEAHLYLPHVSAEEDLAAEPMALEANGGGELYALDVRGLGESCPEPHGSGGFFQPYGMDYMAHGHGILLGESYLGRRVYDLLRTVQLLRAEGTQAIHLYGRGQGAVVALLGAVIDGNLASVTLKNAPQSFRDWTKASLVAWPAACFPRGVLAHFDLP